jgi:serine protease AprX
MAGPETRQRVAVRVVTAEDRDAAVSILRDFDPDVHLYDGLVTGWAARDTIVRLMERGLFVDESSADKSGPAPSLPEAPDILNLADAAGIESLLQQLQQQVASVREGPVVARGGLAEAGGTATAREVAPGMVVRSTTADAQLRVAAGPLARAGAAAADGLSYLMFASAQGLVRVSSGRFAPWSNYLSRGAVWTASRQSLPVVPPDRIMYEVQLVGPMRPEWAAKLDSLKLEIASYAPPFRYRIAMTDAQKADVAGLDFVHGIERYDLKATLGLGVLEAIQDARRATFDLTVHLPRQLPAMCRLIEQQHGATLLAASRTAIRFRASAADPFLVELADREEAKTLDIYTPPALLLEFGRQIIGVTAINGAPPGWDGSGETVGILDSGVDDTHPDLVGRIERYRPVADATSADLSGHGTHVAGIIAGTGKASGGRNTGVAPGARLSVVGIVNANSEPIFPLDFSEYLQLATAGGAKIVNMSVGRPATKGAYDNYAASIDSFVNDHPEVLIVVAAGNDGTAPNGFPDYQNVNSPAAANNVLAVGACCTIRPGIANTWGVYDSSRFPQPPVSAAGMAGMPIAAAGLSSRGPSANRTIKPDIVAPGTFVLSARASHGTLQSFVPVPQNAGPYIFLNGTSMAAPFVSGAAAIVRQYLRQEMRVEHPSAALMKAMLCASADRLAALVNPSLGFSIGYPDFDQGFGLVNLARLLPHKQRDKFRMAFADVANDSADALASLQPPGSTTKSSRNYTMDVADGTAALRVVLSWTDAPGPGVKNVLFLDVKGPSGAFVGNHEHAYSRIGLFDTNGLQGIPFDRQNNTQIVCIANPIPGRYAIGVSANNTPDPKRRQGYGLCVCGSLGSALEDVKPAF